MNILKRQFRKSNNNPAHHFPSRKSGAGFTLIELLVVIAIIGLLASVVLVALNGARTKARDTKRKADIKQIQTALALYYDSNNSQYPNCGPWAQSIDGTWNTTGCLITALKPYLSRLPVDPTNNSGSPWAPGNYSYFYGVRPDLQEYDLGAQLEVQTDNDRCQVKQWLFHYYTPPGGAAPQVTSPWCSGSFSYSPYMYLDH